MSLVRTFAAALLSLALAHGQARLPVESYQDRVHAAWLGQILGALMGFAFEHRAAAVAPVTTLDAKYQSAPVDDDYYYELVALRAFEKHGTKLTVEQLGEQWKENNAGSWGSSEQARLLLARGIRPPDTGHPRYNRLWFTIGPQFAGDLYGLVAPGMPNLAGRLARELGHINGWAEGADGGVFVAGMHSLAFVESDPKEIVRKAARLIHPSSPYRQCLDLVIAMAERGAGAREVMQAVEDRWHIEYPATNNAVPNGGIVAAAVWFGEGDFLKTVNLAFAAGDFTDADCNAANAGGVVGALRGTRALPAALVAQLHDRLEGEKMGGVALTPPVLESIADIARRTARIGERFVVENGGARNGAELGIRTQTVQTQPAELFPLSRLTEYWNPSWELQRAGFGGAGGGMGGIRGITHLDGDVLATYPRDEVRGVVLTRRAALGGTPSLSLEVCADAGRAWQLDIYVENRRVDTRLISGSWQRVDLDLREWANSEVTLRLMQRVLLGPEKAPGNAYWRGLEIR
ncbi:MAG TPA: hypothetical protein DEH78_25760 [Solibacterales bacterium]|nr:hypothetical protein [Bryobacterales bacterium]